MMHDEESARIHTLPPAALQQYPVIFFTWEDLPRDGGPVPTQAIGSRLERLCALGADLAILAPLRVEDLDAALGARPAIGGRLFLLTSGGGEAYMRGPNGLRLLERRASREPADSLHWVTENLLQARERSARDVLLLGERAAALASSPAAPLDFVHAGLASVEPEDMLEALDMQIDLRERPVRQAFPQASDDPAWLFIHEGFDPFREREVETWFTVANGRTGTRGSLEEGSAVSTPATFVAGVFGDTPTVPRLREPVPAPDWLCLRLRVDGSHLTLTNGQTVEHRRLLDMAQGLVFREWVQRDRMNRLVRMRSVRFASLADRELMALRAEAQFEDDGGTLEWEGCLGVTHAGGPVLDSAVEMLEEGIVAETRGRRGGCHSLGVITFPTAGSPVVRRVLQARDVIGGRLERLEPASIDRLAVVLTARSRPPAAAAVQAALSRARQLGFDEALRRHRDAWRRAWERSDVSIEGDSKAQEAVRFCIYHMISTADPTNPDVSIGARGLAGFSYFGHVFWDTEIFVVPFFIYTQPEVARTLLAYRYHRLAGAIEKARTVGHRGALFPWESADRGTETTPPYGMGPDGEKIPILSGIMEHHISSDVAWATWEYWKATGDDGFMLEMGCELLAETARFWASRASRESDGRTHIRVVVGPDEYHEAVDDNAFTNVTARWTIRRAVDALRWLAKNHPQRQEELAAKLQLSDGELYTWLAVADGLVDGYDPETRLFEQFDGFFKLAQLDIASLRPRPMSADLLLGRDVTATSQVVKQADVVMLCHMLPEQIDLETTRANYMRYEPITVHGSSLSPGIHAAVAARLGLVDQALENLMLAASVDLADNMGNAAAGLHMATMGSIWQAVVMGFGGVRRIGDVVVCDPHLPPSWPRLSFPFSFRGSRLFFTLEEGRIRIDVHGEDAPVHLGSLSDGVQPVASILSEGSHTFVRGPDGTWAEEGRKMRSTGGRRQRKERQ